MQKISSIGVVVIGRNEGDRLIGCLHSLPEDVAGVVYVDSGSTDDSVKQAKLAGAHVVELDLSIPFTAARARNAGFEALELCHDVELVQFVDGDCCLQPGWLETARRFLSDNPDVAVVCGRRKEQHPDHSVYNRLCDWEWNTAIGEADSCGGDSVMRISAFRDAGGFREDLIAGEEPELCVRLRSQGWKVWRLDADMTLHDAAMIRFSQWWKRSRRSGHAFAEGAYLHGSLAERYNINALRRILIWGIFIPLAIILFSIAFRPWLAVAAIVYPAQLLRLTARYGIYKKDSWEIAFFLTLGKFPEAIGVVEFYWHRFRGASTRLIEYK